MADRGLTTVEEMQRAIARVSFANSCLDMGWDWEVSALGLDDDFKLRCSFQRPDTNTGELGRGWGRWWLIDNGVSESGLLKTMFAAAKMIVDHELMEAFKVDGIRPFDPHNDVEDLLFVSGRVIGK